MAAAIGAVYPFGLGTAARRLGGCMGKVADNEQRKLRATFYNNLAAGLTLTSILVPATALLQFGFDLGRWIKALRTGAGVIGYDQIVHGCIVVGATALAYLTAMFFRTVAKAEISRLED